MTDIATDVGLFAVAWAILASLWSTWLEYKNRKQAQIIKDLTKIIQEDTAKQNRRRTK